jgi:hypothetical protein
MVKNLGGNKSKGFARKNMVKKDHLLRTAEDDAELYAQVKKIYGGKMCQVVTLTGDELLCHIRGKFAGRGKRDNFIAVGSWLLVGKREWETETKGKLPNCDLLEVYSEIDKNKLKNNITSVNWSPFIVADSKNTSGIALEDGEDFVFADEKTLEYNELIETQVAAEQTGKPAFVTMDDGEIINVDDI